MWLFGTKKRNIIFPFSSRKSCDVIVIMCHLQELGMCCTRTEVLVSNCFLWCSLLLISMYRATSIFNISICKNPLTFSWGATIFDGPLEVPCYPDTILYSSMSNLKRSAVANCLQGPGPAVHCRCDLVSGDWGPGL